MLAIIYDEGQRLKRNLSLAFEYKGIRIMKKDEAFFFKTAYPYYLKSDNRIALKKYRFYNSEDESHLTFFIYETDAGLKDFGLYEKKDLSIGSVSGNDIVSEDPYLTGKYFRLIEGRIETDMDHVLVNEKEMGSEELKDGDFLSILGFELYYYKGFLYINHFACTINLPPARIEEKTYLFKDSQPIIRNHYLSDNSEIEIEGPKPFERPHPLSDRKLIYQIGPSITMSMAMGFVASISIYTSYQERGFTLSLLALGVMPLTIMISGILWPALNRSAEKRKYHRLYQKAKEHYLDYLKTYEKETLTLLNRYRTGEDYYRFKETDVRDKLFYISSRSKMFFSLNIGTYTKTYDLAYEFSGDKEIDEKLIALKNRTAAIGNLPLFIDFKALKRLSLITSDTSLLIRKFILELAYKYAPSDLAIAVLTKNESIIEDIYALPHLFYRNHRLLFESEAEMEMLEEIEDRPVILLSDLPLNLKTEKVNIVSFSANPKTILKDADAIIEDHGFTSLLFFNAERSLFAIDKPDISYSEYLHYISSLAKAELFKAPYSFFADGIKPDIRANYENHDHKLKAYFAYEEGKLLNFDLHETAEGPHGLIGGSTGSGKSELLVSLLLSLALRYPPTYLNMILIDYKGGGIKESLSYEGRSIPHIIAALDNLENGAIVRLLVAIDFELKKRERLFRQLSDKSGLSIMSLDDYLNVYKTYDLPELAHLLILVDEFAELKKEEPDLIKKLISFSRIGRSLGLHLILATQKPSGVIDDEIWSNSHFKIALKVHDEKDAKEIIHSGEAASLINPGEFYLRVDRTLRKARSIYAKQDIANNGKYEVGILNKRLELAYRRLAENKMSEYESAWLCKEILKTSKELGLKTKELPFRKPPNKDLSELGFNPVEKKLVFGETDDYLRARSGRLAYDINANLFICSFHKGEINNLIYELNLMKREMLLISDKKYSLGHLAEVIRYDDEEDIDFLFDCLAREKKRQFTLLIENLTVFLSYSEKYGEKLLKLLKRSGLSGFSIIALSDCSILNYKLLSAFDGRLLIGSKDPQDLVNVFGFKGEYKGTSFYFDEKPLPFIEAKPVSLIPEEREVLSYLPRIPEVIKTEVFANRILIGYRRKTRAKFYWPQGRSLLITGYDETRLEEYRQLLKGLEDNICRYESSLCLKNYEAIIWTGEGIYNQRLFYPSAKVELAEGEGYLFHNGQGEIISLVNHECNHTSLFYHV